MWIYCDIRKRVFFQNFFNFFLDLNLLSGSKMFWKSYGAFLSIKSKRVVALPLPKEVKLLLRQVCWYLQYIFQYNTISLSSHEQICLSRLRFDRYFYNHPIIFWNVAYLNILVHDVINLLYYEYWTDKQKHFYIYILMVLQENWKFL